MSEFDDDGPSHEDPRLLRVERKLDGLTNRIGRAERLAAVEVARRRHRDRDIQEIKDGQTALLKKLQDVLDLETERRGGRKMLNILTATGSGLIALIVSWWQTKSGK